MHWEHVLPFYLICTFMEKAKIVMKKRKNKLKLVWGISFLQVDLTVQVFSQNRGCLGRTVRVQLRNNTKQIDSEARSS